MKLLFICDPSDYAQPDNDIPLTYRWAAQDPRIELFHLPTDGVTGKSHIDVARVPAGHSHDAYLALNDRLDRRIQVSDIDVVFCRTRKPFPPGYLDRLGRWAGATRFLNSPINKKEQIEPGFLARVAGPFTPETLITNDPVEARAFLAEHRIIVAKRANSSGGLGVYKIWRTGGLYRTDNIVEGERVFTSMPQVLHHIQENQGDVLDIVRYLPRALEGDKRVVVIDGEIYGAYTRLSRSGHWVQNLSSSDSTCFLSDVGAAERDAIAGTWPYYKSRGLRTLGYDFLIDDDGSPTISEINVGNIGGIARLQQLTGEPVVERFISWIIDFHRAGERAAHAALAYA